MSATPSPAKNRAARSQRGFSLIELMVTVAIALFLMDGLVTIVQNVRKTYLNQQLLAQLQDQQRFAMTVMTDVIQAGGYYPSPVNYTEQSALPAGGPWAAAGQAFWGTYNGGTAPGDTLNVRYMTAIGDGVILCNGGSNTTFAPTHTYTNTFSIVVGAQGSQLMCQLDGAAPVPLVNGVTNLTIYYGVKRDFTFNDYNVDTYLTANNMLAADWSNISSVRIVLQFQNPLWPQPGQNQFINFERVVEVMGRAGVHT
jgi:type IV pilus assembly protein PilW